MEFSTQLSELSGSLNTEKPAVLFALQEAYQKNIQLANMQIEQMLSATNVLLQTTQAKLSTVPTHPYEYWRYKYLDPNKRPKTIFELDFPQTFSPTVATQQISAMSYEYDDVMMTQIQVLSSQESSVEPTLNIFATLSGDKFVVNESKMRKHIEFHEMVRTVPIDEIERNPVIVAYKLLDQFIKTYA